MYKETIKILLDEINELKLDKLKLEADNLILRIENNLLKSVIAGEDESDDEDEDEAGDECQELKDFLKFIMEK